MPRYFFHNEDGESYLDSSGVELANDTAAKIEAASLLGEMLKDREADDPTWAC